MKKSLLIATVLLCASTATGNTVAQQHKTTVKPTENASVCQMMPLATPEYAEMATPGNPPRKVKAKASPDDGTPKAFYKRPAGAFYGFVKVAPETSYMKFSQYYAPYLTGWKYQTATYEQRALNIGENPTYNWTYQVYDYDAKERVYLNATGENLSVYYREVDEAPTLVAQGSEGEAEYTFGGYKVSGSGSNKTLGDKVISQYIGGVEFATSFNNTAGATLYASSKFRAASTNRDGSNMVSGTYSTGALDAEGGKTGKWYGHNYSGIDALAMAFEKPSYPYVLRKVGVVFQNLAFATQEMTDFTVNVYKLADIPQYNDTVSVYAEPGELIATGTFTADPADFAANSITSGIMQFELMLEDDGTGLEITVEPEIDFPILVVFTGFNDPNVTDFTLTQSSDLWDEGFGELCYMGRTQEDGSIKYQGLNNFFSSGERKTGLSIYIDTYRPFLVYNYTNETGQYEFPINGDSHTVELYSYSPAEEFELTTEDGGEIPAWLDLTLRDKKENDEWTGIVYFDATAQPLPEGTAYREAKIKLHINGSWLIYTITQGTKPADNPGNPVDVNSDGVVDMADVNIAINVVLGKGQQGDYNADVNGDNVVDMADINMIINYMLGK